MLAPPSGKFFKQCRFCERVWAIRTCLEINFRMSCNFGNVFHRKNVVIVDRGVKHPSLFIFSDLFLDKTLKTFILMIYSLFFCTTCFNRQALITC